MQELGISTLISCFINANRDPKSAPTKPQDFFYHLPEEDRERIPANAANSFFRLAEEGKIPGWAVAIAPIDQLLKSKTEAPCKPTIIVGENSIIINSKAQGNVLKFEFALVQKGDHSNTRWNGKRVIIPDLDNCCILDDQFNLEV